MRFRLYYSSATVMPNMFDGLTKGRSHAKLREASNFFVIHRMSGLVSSSYGHGSAK